MDSLPEVFSDRQPSGCWVQQVGDDLLVDLQEAASAYEPHLLPLPLLGQQTKRSIRSCFNAAAYS